MKNLILVAILITAGALIGPKLAVADTVCSNVPQNPGPSLNHFPISENGGDCMDYPLVAVRNDSTGGGYSGSVDAEPGQNLHVRLYVHNGVMDTPENIAHNVQIASDIPTANGGGILTGRAWADNHGTVYGDVYINLPANSHLEYVPGSARVYSRGPNLLGGFSDNVVGGGASLGDMQGCYTYLRFVTYDVRVVAESAPSTGTIRVNSNIPTSWVISGPANYAGSGTNANYNNAPISGPDYFINFPHIFGYKEPVVYPSISQTLHEGQLVTWSVYYQSNDNETPNNPTPTPGPTPTPTPSPEPSDPTCFDNALGSVVSGLPASLAPGQTANFTVRFANTGNTVWHHGAWYYGKQLTAQNVVVTATNPHQSGSIGLTHLNPPDVMFPLGYESWGPTVADWTMQLTAPTTPGNYSMTFQMFYDGTDFGIGDYKQTPETRPYPCRLSDGSLAIQQPSTYFGNPVTLNFTVGTVQGEATGTIRVTSNKPTNWTLSPADNAHQTFQTSTPSTTDTYTAVPDTYTLAPQTIPGFVTVITSSANSGPVSNSATQTLGNSGNITFNINYLPALANLNPSSKNLISVTSGVSGTVTPYNSSTVIKAGDTLTFQVVIINDGTADAFIQKIVDVPSANLVNLRNVFVNKGNGFTSGSNSGNTINISGFKSTEGGNWLIKYNMTVTSLDEAFGQLKNCATIYYSDPAGDHTLTRCFGPLLFKNPNGGAPVFREIAP